MGCFAREICFLTACNILFGLELMGKCTRAGDLGKGKEDDYARVSKSNYIYIYMYIHISCIHTSMIYKKKKLKTEVWVDE